MGLLEDLLNPSALPDPTSRVSLVQTHISMVFVGDAFVYKVKKPVNFGFLDFSTLERRAFYCGQEVSLNRRLSEDLYLDVLPVFFEGGRHHLLGGGGGAPVDYAVRMRRIPEEYLMRAVFARNALTEAHLAGVAEVIARFHARAERSEAIDGFGDPDQFRINTDENFQQTAPYVGRTLSLETWETLRAWTDAFYAEHGGLFRSRIAGGRIRDCHGDLHMEHICLTPGYPIFDCIEFNERFRYSDTLADIAFLLMDLDYHGGRDASGFLWQSYRKAALEEGQEIPLLLRFYKIYRAFVRGKVIGFEVSDPRIDEKRRQEAEQRASRYFALALSYVA